MTMLIDCTRDAFQRGSVLRDPGKYQYEVTVNFMIFKTQEKDRSFGFIVTIGYNSRLDRVCLPAGSQDCTCRISKEWQVK